MLWYFLTYHHSNSKHYRQHNLDININMASNRTPQSSPTSSTGSSSPPTPENPCYPYPVAMYYNPWNTYDPYHATNQSNLAMYGMPMHYPMLPQMMPSSIAGGMTSQQKAAYPTTQSKTTLANTELSPIKDEPKFSSKEKELSNRSTEDFRAESRSNRTNYSRKQIEVLERMFCSKAYPDPEDFERLGKELGIAMKCIKVWFQNKRARSRKRVGGQTTFTKMIPQPYDIPISVFQPKPDVSPPISVPSTTTRSPIIDLSTKSTSSPPMNSLKSEPGNITSHRKSQSPNGSQPSTKSPAMLLPAPGQPMMPPMPYYPGYMPYPMFTYPYMYSQCR